MAIKWSGFRKPTPRAAQQKTDREGTTVQARTPVRKHPVVYVWDKGLCDKGHSDGDNKVRQTEETFKVDCFLRGKGLSTLKQKM